MTLAVDGLTPTQLPVTGQDIALEWGAAVDSDLHTLEGRIISATFGIGDKGMARALSTSNVASLSGPQTVGGVALIAGDVVVLTAQSTGTQDGSWQVNAGAWTRPANYATGSTQKPNTIWQIAEGTNAETSWWISSNANIVVDTDTPTITQAYLFVLGNTAVTPGTYTNCTITVGADGRITAASSGSAGYNPMTDTILMSLL